MKPSTNPYLLSALGAEIKVRRQELGLSQDDLAGRCELDRPYISLIEVGKKQPSLSVLWRIATGLEWRLSTLAERVERRYEHEERIRAAAESGKRVKNR
jgi:transcriptional regulator with XRE-family HTH domain